MDDALFQAVGYRTSAELLPERSLDIPWLGSA